METLWQDLRYTARMLAKSPGFTFFAMAVLALGIAASTTIFSIANTVLLRPLPYRDAGRLVIVYEDASFVGFPRNTPAVANYVDWRAENRTFEDLAATRQITLNLTGDGRPEQVQALAATSNFFPLLGVEAALGRVFTADEDQPGAPHVAVLSHRFWVEQFGADSGIIGRGLQFDGEKYTVIGVMPRGFQFPDRDREMWIPAAFTPEELANRGRHFLRVVGRLKPGVTLRQANADLAAIAARLAAQYPDSNGQLGAFAASLRLELAGDARLAILVLLGAVGFVLLIACANVASLLLARAARRQRELSVRMALGAGRLRIVRQMLTESVLLSVVAGAAGVALSLWFIALARNLIPVGITPAAGVDAAVLIFAVAISVATGILFGTLPALRFSRFDLTAALKQGGARGSVGGGHAGLRSLLVVSEIALALVLLTGGALMLQSFLKLRGLDPGFRTDHVLALQTSLPSPKYAAIARRTAFYDQVLERVARLPGVVSAGYTTWLPLTNRGGASGISVEGRPADEGFRIPNTRSISPDYLRALSIPLIAGRLFDGRDRADAPLVALVNQTAARALWPDQNPLGRRFKFGGPGEQGPWVSVAGVVGDVHQMGLDVPPRAEIYVPYPQHEFFAPAWLAVKTAGDPLLLANAVREQTWAVDPDQPVAGVMALQDLLDDELAPRKVQASVLTGFAGMALLLAALGIYAVLSFTVAQRTPEIGVRIALGAQPADVLRMILGAGARLAAAGVAVGLAASFALSRILGHLLYGVSASDPATFVAVSLLLAAVALAACYLPARRAMRVDPMVALRYE